MSIRYLEELERDINCGKSYFTCSGASANEWYLSHNMRNYGLGQSAAQHWETSVILTV